MAVSRVKLCADVANTLVGRLLELAEQKDLTDHEMLLTALLVAFQGAKELSLTRAEWAKFLDEAMNRTYP